MPLDREGDSYQVTYQFPVDLPDPADLSKPKRKILEEVGDYLVDTIRQYCEGGKSPVAGHGDFKLLSKDYADRMKGGVNLPDLNLTGSMLDHLTYKIVGDTLVIGVFSGKKNKAKAYAHNTGFEGHKILEDASLMRRFIPDEDAGETFKKAIVSGIDEIVSDASKY